jgi:hypothetical protein
MNTSKETKKHLSPSCLAISASLARNPSNTCISYNIFFGSRTHIDDRVVSHDYSFVQDLSARNWTAVTLNIPSALLTRLFFIVGTSSTLLLVSSCLARFSNLGLWRSEVPAEAKSSEECSGDSNCRPLAKWLVPITYSD